MRKFLALAVLGTSLVFASSAAFAGDRGSEPSQNETMVSQDESSQSTVAGAPAPVSVVDTSREGSNAER